MAASVVSPARFSTARFSETRLATALVAASLLFGFSATGANAAQETSGKTEAKTEVATKADATPSVATAAALAEMKEDENLAGAISFAERLTGDATSALMREDSAPPERLADFQGVLTNGLALDVIGKFMLGASRKQMSDDQMARYNAIFPDYITKQYAEQFQDIVGQPLDIVDAKPISKKDTLVRTQFARNEGGPINVDWRIRELKTGDRKAIDIIVGGVSIMLVKREEFTAFIAKNGVDSLLDRLEREVTV